MPYNLWLEQTLPGRVHPVKVEIFKDTETAPEVRTNDVEPSVQIQYSDPSGGNFLRGDMPSYVRLNILDEGRGLFDDMKAARDAGASDRKYKLVLTAGPVTWRGYVQLKNIRTFVHWQYLVPTIRIQAADGLGKANRMQLPVAGSDSSIHSVFRQTLAYELLPLDILYGFRWRPSTEPTPGDAIQTDPNQGEDPYVPRTGLPAVFSTYPPEERLKTVTDNFLLRVWQGLDGRWYVMQPNMIGKTAARLEGGELWEYRPPEEEVAGSRGYIKHVGIDNTPITADETNFELESELSAEDPAARITVSFSDDLRVGLNTVDGSEKGMAGDKVQGPAMNLVRDGFFSHWQSDYDATYYEEVNGSGGNDVVRDTVVYVAGSDAAEIHPQGKVKARLPYVQGGEETFLQFQFYATQRNTADGGTDETQRHEFEIILHGDSQDWWLQSDGTFSGSWASISTGDYYSQPTSGGTGIQWAHFFVRTVEAPPESGWFEIVLKGCYYNSTSGATGPGDITQQTTHTVTVDDLGAFPVTDDGAIDNEYGGEVEFKTNQLTDPVGAHLEIERDWFNWQTYRYNDADSGRVQYAPTVQFWDGATLDWIQYPDWLEAGSANRYHTLAEMQVRQGWFKQMPRLLDKVEGELMQVAPPEKAIYLASEGKTFMALNLTIKLIEWTTEGQWIENARYDEDLGTAGEGLIINYPDYEL